MTDPNFKLRHDGAATFELPPGTYTVDEVLVPAYELTAVACDDPRAVRDGYRAIVTVDLNQHVTCTFKNTKKP